MDTSPPSRLAQVRRAVFARHANPWSAWSRWATAPLALVPVWTRDWRHAAAVAAWFAVNPVIFPEPAHNRAWASRAMLGEELWLLDRPLDAAMGVNAAATAIGLASVIAARRRLPVTTVATSAASMALLLVYWELMARYHDERQAEAPAPAAEPGSG
ncbi:hypothetical protein CLV63_105105 [Murinocardiopsis flavida]|uniref:Uncharacterized protein n=1 Tax=Murinocardiopsis flavida TaxID=645275 RepID=A0A2P8DMJ8_9ACTN|nr:DUF6653 family protein [Murinocardiopsis flavida]PSK98431.1 hypothetical protein CLV63_105105 [Murinocardiopsis flavida]